MVTELSPSPICDIQVQQSTTCAAGCAWHVRRQKPSTTQHSHWQQTTRVQRVLLLAVSGVGCAGCARAWCARHGGRPAWRAGPGIFY